MQNRVNDLNECDKEPIHIPGAIQPHGYLIAIQIPTGLILYVSENLHDITGVSNDEILNSHYQTVMLNSSLSRIVNLGVRQEDYEYESAQDKLWIRNPDGSEYFDVLMHVDDTILTIELVPEEMVDSVKRLSVQSLVAQANSMCLECMNTQELEQKIPEFIHRFTGFDRVMLYKFDEEYNGQVIAEAKYKEVDSFFNHFFPASDIPAQARELYKTNLLRIIGDVNYQPVPVVKSSGVDDELDMSFSTLRSVSPIHIEYLHNMRIQSSMSMSIVCEGRLWGLIACHHREPRFIPYSMWNGFITLSQIFSNNLALRTRLDANANQINKDNLLNTFLHIFGALVKKNTLLDALDEVMDHALNLFQASGCFLISETEAEVQILKAWQLDLREEEMIRMHETLRIPTKEGSVYATDSLKNPNVFKAETKKDVSGMLAVPFKTEPFMMMVFVRPELLIEKCWAGNPAKEIFEDEHGMRISPRKSFESWKETVSGHCIPWDALEMDLADRFSTHLSEIINSKITHQDLIQAKKTLAEKESFLIQQSKMAAMGEMIHAITHQWKQPLTALSLALQMNESLKCSEIQGVCMDQVKFMNQTIDDFREFFKPVSITKSCDLIDALDHLMRILGKVYEKDNIVITHNIADIEKPVVQGARSVFQQALMNIMSNSKDAILDIKKQDKRFQGKINMQFSETDSQIVLHYRDNGGGIPDLILQNIFEPYVSSKGDKGTGIGMQITHDIITEKMNGNIMVENLEDGVHFAITLNKEIGNPEQ